MTDHWLNLAIEAEKKGWEGRASYFLSLAIYYEGMMEGMMKNCPGCPCGENCDGSCGCGC